jgi:DNA-binding MarR family transcriptional regulator
MEDLLIEFINTLDLSLKMLQAEADDASGLSKLTIHQFQYIDAIHALGEPNITEIADRLHITKASVTTGINKLINLGYVIKSQSSQDKRIFHVRLTEASERLIEAKFQTLKAYGEFVEASLSKDEARQFKTTLSKLVKLFKQSEQ